MGNKTKTEIEKNDYYYYIRDKYATLIKDFEDNNDGDSLDITEYIPDQYVFSSDMESLSKEDQFEILKNHPKLVDLLENPGPIASLLNI